MIDNLLAPVVLCFACGLVAGLLRSGLRVPQALYESLSLFLLLAIGLKGGLELARTGVAALILPVVATLILGVVIPLVAYVILRRLRFGRPDAGALAAHYGSVSAVTFAVVLAYLGHVGVPYEPHVTVLLVVLEIPAIVVGILLARSGGLAPGARGPLLREVLLGGSIVLLVSGLVIGAVSGPRNMRSVEPVFLGLFEGALALFLLEMGLVASRRMGDLRRVGLRLILFAVAMPVISATLGVVAGVLSGLSVGGTVALATLAGSASYIAAPAAVRASLPEANPTYYLTASLGITFPFNIIVGVPLYHRLSEVAHGLVTAGV